MTDYNSLLATAVAGLEENTREARRRLYERARAAQLKLLEGRNPPLSETEIIRERQALEQTIFKIEATTTQRSKRGPEPRSSRPPLRFDRAQDPTPRYQKPPDW